MNKKRPGFTIFFAALIFLFPASAWSQNGGKDAAELKKIFESRGFYPEEGFLFSDPEARDEAGPMEPGAAARDAGASLLIRFPGTARADPAAGEAEEAKAFSPESGFAVPPLMVAAFPLRGPGTAEQIAGETGGAAPGLPYAAGIALALAEQLRARQTAGRGLPGDLLIAFLGEADARQYEKAGSRAAGELAAYGGLIGEPEHTFFWFMDLPEPPQSLLIHHGTSRTIAPLDALRRLQGPLRSLGIPYGFAVPFNEFYKLGFAEGPEILSFTQEQEINALYFTGAGSTGLTGPEGPPEPVRGAGSAGIAGQDIPAPEVSVSPADSPAGISAEALAELILLYAADTAVPENPGENQDYHYLILPLPGNPVFFSQKHAVLLLLLFAAVFFSGFLLYRGFHSPPPAMVRIFFRCLWVVGGYFFLLFAALEWAGLAVSLISAGRINSTPLLYGWVTLKLILSLGIFALISIPLGNYRIPLRANFSGAVSFLLILLDVFIAAWADICFIPFFLGALFLIFLGTQFKHPILVYICALLAPFYGVLVGFFSIFSGHRGLGNFLLSNRPGPAAMMILVFLPFVLLFKRGISLARRGKTDLRRRLIPFYVLMGLALVLGLALLLAASPNFSFWKQPQAR